MRGSTIPRVGSGHVRVPADIRYALARSATAVRALIAAAVVPSFALLVAAAAPAAAQSLTITGTITEVAADNEVDALDMRPGDRFTFTFDFPPGSCGNSYDGCGMETRAFFVGQVGPVRVLFNQNSGECRAFPHDCGYSVDAYPQTVWWNNPHDLLSIDSSGDGFIVDGGPPVRVRILAGKRDWFGPIPFSFPPASIPDSLDTDVFEMRSFDPEHFFLIKGRINCFVNCVPLAIRTSSLPPVHPSQPYQTQLQAVGGTGNYSWFVDGLPPGVYFTTAGHIWSTGNEGAPGGTYQVHIELRDNGTGETKKATLPLIVSGCSAWALTQQVVSLNYQGGGGSFTVVLGNSSQNQCEYAITSVGLYPALGFMDAGGTDISRGVLAPGTSRQLSVNVSSPLPNPYCSFRYLPINVVTLDVATRARFSITLRAEWAPRPPAFTEDGIPVCQPDRTVDPARPGDHRPGLPSAGGVRS